MNKLMLAGVAAGATLAAGSAFAASSFQNTCSNITFAYSGNNAAVQAVCLRANGTPNSTSLVIQGISNQNGQLTGGGSGPASFQQSCGNIQILADGSSVQLSALCRTTGGQSNPTGIELDGISNNNGVLSQ